LRCLHEYIGKEFLDGWQHFQPVMRHVRDDVLPHRYPVRLEIPTQGVVALDPGAAGVVDAIHVVAAARPIVDLPGLDVGGADNELHPDPPHRREIGRDPENL